MTKSDTRARILDAYERLLVNGGTRVATLDAVAAEAGVSKGGLLYHFASKDELRDAMLDRLKEQGERDVEKMLAAPEGAAWYFLRTSMDTGSDFDRAIIAASSIAFESDTKATEALASIRNQWFEVIKEQLGDEALARTIQLIGDGMYFDDTTGLSNSDVLNHVAEILRRLGLDVD